MAKESVLEGVFAINKPIGMSSAQVIRDCQTYFNPSAFFRPLIQQEADLRARESNASHRRRSKAKRDMRVKMGHGGTLDPLATGVLILGVGRGTKDLNRFLLCHKTYEAVVLFGASTDTYDRVGRVLKRRPYDGITRERVEEALGGFRGTFQQMPPLYSALKMNGRPLYEYAREGLSIPREIETRTVDVFELELVEWYEPGQHAHRWPSEEAGMAEQTLAERVWRIERDQAEGKTKPRTAEEERSDQEALAAHEAFKRSAEETQDELIYDKPPNKRRRAASSASASSSPLKRNGPHGSLYGNRTRHAATSAICNEDLFLMSGALGELPSSPYNSSAGTPNAAASAPTFAGDAVGDSAGAETGAGAGAGVKAGAKAEAGAISNEENHKGAAQTRSSAGQARNGNGQKEGGRGRGGGGGVGGRGSNLVPPPPSPNTPPPWEGKGPPAAKIRLTVGSGFYVRSFCHDLGEKLGSAALMAELVRARQSDFCVGTDTVLEYDDLSKGEAEWAPKVERLLRRYCDGEIGQVPEVGKDKVERKGGNEREKSRGGRSGRGGSGDSGRDNGSGADAALPAPVPSKTGTSSLDVKDAAAAESSESAVKEASTTETAKGPVPPTPSGAEQDAREQDSRSVGGESEWNGFSDDNGVTSAFAEADGAADAETTTA